MESIAADLKKIYENRQMFWDKLLAFWSRKKMYMNWPIIINGFFLDLQTLYDLVVERGGLLRVVKEKKWSEILEIIKFPGDARILQLQYEKYLYAFECDELKVSTGDETTEETENSSQETQGSEFLVAEWFTVQGTTASSSQAVEIDVNHMEQQNVSLVMPSGSAKRKHDSNELCDIANSAFVESPIKRSVPVAQKKLLLTNGSDTLPSDGTSLNRSKNAVVLTDAILWPENLKKVSKTGDERMGVTVLVGDDIFTGFLFSSP